MHSITTGVCEMEEKIINILNEDARDDIDWAAQTAIVDDELIDSLDMVAIIGDMNEEFDIEISVDEMTGENFNSVAAMCAMVKKLQEA
jgi:D-alanine--poly(phosphoribitol) ligase subunit 2